MRVIILGTGTNVGKTYVSSCLARGLRLAEARVLALKPIESGVEPGNDGDAGELARAAGHALPASPWRLRRPVSPHLAAREQGLELRLSDVVDWVEQQEREASPQLTLIESAGGAFSPLARGATNVDLALALEPALWLLIAPDALGVLHDLTATLKALPRAPDAVLLSGARASDASTGTNTEELARLGIVEVLETLARGANSAPAAVRWLLASMNHKSAHE